MGDDDKAKMARTEALFRDVNERIAETTVRFAANEAGLVCECSDASCTHPVSVPLEQYELVRENGTRFFVAHGHDTPQIEVIVEKRDGFDVVEKVDAIARETVERLDPRAA